MAAPNEDAFHLNVDAGVAAVFDGLAGHGSGDVASAAAREALHAFPLDTPAAGEH